MLRVSSESPRRRQSSLGPESKATEAGLGAASGQEAGMTLAPPRWQPQAPLLLPLEPPRLRAPLHTPVSFIFTLFTTWEPPASLPACQPV